MKTLPAQELRPGDYARLLERVNDILWDLVYAPIVAVVAPALPRQIRRTLAPQALEQASAHELRNAPEDALRQALRAGAVQLLPGAPARFAVAKPDRRVSDALRAFGAKLDKRTGDWTCAPEAVPTWVRAEAQSYAARAQAVHEQAQELLKRIAAGADAFIEDYDLGGAAEHAVTEVAGGWRGAAKKVEAGWNLGAAGQGVLAAEFARTRDIPIRSPGSKVSVVDAFEGGVKASAKVWAQEALARLRAEVEANAAQGYRAEGLAERIRNEYGVSKGRAALIARQETSNFMANYRAARAADAGLKRYRWYCVRDSRTRPDHKKLHGTIQRYDQPPITDSRSGARNNPGSDFRCRCVDLPIIE